MTTRRKIFDVTLSLSETLLVWPGDPPVSITQSSEPSNGQTITVSRLSFGAHTGTHVDAPAHFIQGGSLVNSLDLHTLIGEVLVVDASDADMLSANVLKELHIPGGTQRVLFRTRNSERWTDDKNPFIEDYVGITGDGARWLVSQGVRLVGTDYLSVCAFEENESGHVTLLDAGVILIESLNLYDIVPGTYLLICLPLKITGAEGAPARVVLVEQ